MSKRSALVWVLRILLIAITVYLIFLLTRPVVIYFESQPKPVSSVILNSKAYTNKSYAWLQKHFKWTPADEAVTPDLIWLDDPAMLTTDFEALLNHNTVIGEFLGASERATRSQQEQVEMIFDINYTGYVGKACKDLGDPFEISDLVRKQYELLYRQKWNFTGKGILLFSNTSVSVLEKGKDYTGDLMWVSDGLRMPFGDYFEVITTNQPVTSHYEANFTKKGLLQLSALGLNPSFPASVETAHPLYNGLYFTSAFKKNSINVPYFFSGIEGLMANKQLYERGTTEEIYWKWYVKKMQSVETHILTKTPSPKTSVASSEPTFKVEGQQITRRTAAGIYEPFFIKGVNLGAAVPGKTFTEFPKDVSVYSKWLNQMKLLHINTLRVYTLLPPAFYKALYDHNQTAETPIYLLQEIWPEEKPLNEDYLATDYNETYRREIEYVVHAVHGNANVPKRSYRAYGAYAYDVSPYLIGYLVGRELEPDEVIATDTRNPGYHFKGQYLYGLSDSTPTENWLAASCDYALSVETKDYGRQSLVAIVNWPTLDPLDHFSEWNTAGDKSRQFNDKTVVDINRIGIHADKMPGFFGAYHIYPNYPDFMNNDPEYAAYTDDQGRFRYGGYLQAFMAQHKKYPALIAEYGISTSMMTAHVAPDGNNHGGITEIEQGPQLIRMTKAIQHEGYAGALIFEWLDEWVKKTWITEPYMIPYNRHALWHNVMDPEQNYGLMAMIANPAEQKTSVQFQGAPLTQVSVQSDASFITLTLVYNSEEQAQQSTEVLINTHSPQSGTAAWEYKLQLDAAPKLYVNPGYNWTKNRFEAKKIPPDQFEAMTLQTNGEGLLKNGVKIPSIQISLSDLRVGTFDDLHAQVQRIGKTVTVRLPHMLLGISDPSSKQVLSDPEVYSALVIDQVKTVTSPQLQFQISKKGQAPIELFHELKAWDELTYTSRPKASFEMLGNYFKTID